MPIDRSLWRPVWQEGEYPSLPCPRCGSYLNLNSESLVVKTAQHDINLFAYVTEEEIVPKFSCWMQCGYADCGEVVSVSGYLTHHLFHANERDVEIARNLHPKVIIPSPPIIQIGKEVPGDIQEHLARSFTLFWIDNEACANRLRVALELVLKAWGFPREDENGRPVTLHQRIEKWQALYGRGALGMSLMALKWLGNAGSHEDGISRDRILDAYDIFASALKALFPEDLRPIEQLANDIVKSKGT